MANSTDVLDEKHRVDGDGDGEESNVVTKPVTTGSRNKNAILWNAFIVAKL
jgi:hypothetical protein